MSCGHHVAITWTAAPTKYKFLKVQMSRDNDSTKVKIPPAKYKFLKVQMSRDQHVDSGSDKVQIHPTKYKFHKVQMSRDHHMDSSSQIPQKVNIKQLTYALHKKEQVNKVQLRQGQPKTQNKGIKPYNTATQNSHSNREILTTWARKTPKHTPYGPHNLPCCVPVWEHLCSCRSCASRSLASFLSQV